jgi:hypothetical protein
VRGASAGRIRPFAKMTRWTRLSSKQRIEAVAAAVAVVKGHVTVPVDPAPPSERLEHVPAPVAPAGAPDRWDSALHARADNKGATDALPVIHPGQQQRGPC